MSARIPKWQERMGHGYVDGGADLPEEVAMKAEIADLRTDNDALRARIAELEAALKDALVSSGLANLALEQSAAKLQQADDYIEKLEAAQPTGQAATTASASEAHAAHAGAAEDTARLDFLIQYGAHIAHTMDGEMCNVWLTAERDGTEARPAEGWPQKRYDDGRKAIDAARKALVPATEKGKP
jgi:hypothetical protein